MDDKEKLKDLERKKLLEEIRKRAEEAELKRIEEGEQRADLTTSPLASPEPPPPPKSSLPPSPPPHPSVSPEESRLKAAREKFFIAIDRGKTDKAEELLVEIGSLVADRTEVAPLRERLEELRREQLEEARAKKRAAEQKPKAQATSRAQREAQQKKIAALFEKANSYYQSEKYDKGLESLNELFAMDDENEEARQLAADITRAQELAERIREEESRRKAEEAAAAVPAPPQPPPRPQESGDAWGNKEVMHPENVLGLPTVAEGVASPPKSPFVERLVERVSNIHIPLKPVLIGIGVLVLAASAYFIVDSLAVFPQKYSLLVLPASGTSTDSSTQFLADAVTEDLIMAVSSVNKLRVVAPVTALSLGTNTGNPSQIARSLGANYFLQWTVSKADDRIAFQLVLSDTLSTSPVWSAQRQNSMRELQSAVGEIAHAVIREMNIEEDKALTGESNTSSEAYEAYARGRWYLRRGDLSSVNMALSSFAIALERDPRFQEAHLALAWAHLLTKEYDIDTTSSHVNFAWSHLNEAIAMGASSSESHRIRGLIALYQSQYDRAVDELERAAALAPSDAETQRRLAAVYVIRGRTNDAVKAAMHALADDPRNVDSYTVLGMIQHFRDEPGRFQGRSSDEYPALQSIEQGIRYAPDKSKYMSEGYADLLHYTRQSERAALILEDRAVQTQHYADYYRLGRLYQTVGRAKQVWEEKLQNAKTLVEATIAANSLDAHAYSYLALVETRLGAFKNALEASTRARQLAPSDLDILYDTARMFALQTDKKQALEYLGKAIDRRYRLSSILDMDLYNLRAEPEFQQTVTR